jgi:Flp pilus assembly pilin Flp
MKKAQIEPKFFRGRSGLASLRGRSGQTVAEYIFILSLCAIVLIIALSAMLQKGFGGAFNTYKNVLMIPYPFK